MKVYLVFEYDYLTEYDSLVGVFDSEDKAAERIRLFTKDMTEYQKSTYRFEVREETVQ